MNKKILIVLIVFIMALCGGMVWLFMNLQEQKQVNKDMQELAELVNKEMCKQYTLIAVQYRDMYT